MRFAQVITSACVVLSILPMIPGCATVDPVPDYQRTERLILDRTGVSETYEPQADELVSERVDRLLADGLTVDEAVRVALLNNRSFQSLFQEIGVSRADVIQSGLLTNPSLGISLRFPEGGGRSNLTLGFAQQLVDLWQIPVRKRISQTQLEQTVLTVVRRAIDLAGDVEVKYYRHLALLRARQIAHQNLELVKRSLRLAQNRFHAGEVGQLDVNLARANLLDVQFELISLERESRIADTALARVLGLLREKRAWKLKDALPEQAVPIADHATLLTFAMKQRTDARAAELQVRAAEDEIKRQYLNIFPNVTAGVELESLERRGMPGRKIVADTARASLANGQLTAPGIQSRGERRLERSQIIDALLGPTLDITLPIWHQNQPEIAKARFKAQQRRKEYEDLLDSVAQDVEQALTSTLVAEELLGFFQTQALPQSEDNVEAARRAYQAGEQSILALMDAQKLLIAQRREYTNVRRDYAIAQAELKRAVGGRLPSISPTSAPSTQPSPP